jgi:hypothetical protein
MQPAVTSDGCVRSSAGLGRTAERKVAGRRRTGWCPSACYVLRLYPARQSSLASLHCTASLTLRLGATAALREAAASSSPPRRWARQPAKAVPRVRARDGRIAGHTAAPRLMPDATRVALGQHEPFRVLPLRRIASEQGCAAVELQAARCIVAPASLQRVAFSVLLQAR